MSRAAAALLLLVALAPLAPAQAPFGGPAGSPFGSFGASQRTFAVGGLNVTTWIVQDVKSLSFGDETIGALEGLASLNYTAGSLATLYFQARVLPNGTGADLARASLSSPSPLVQFVSGGPGVSEVPLEGRPCRPQGSSAVLCEFHATRAELIHAFQFYTPAAAPPGSFQLNVLVEAFRNTTGGPQLLEQHNEAYALQLLDPVPPFVARRQVGPATVAAWVSGGRLGAAGGCLAGPRTPRADTTAQGQPAGVCVLAFTSSPEQVRVDVNATGPGFVTVSPAQWSSGAINDTSGGLRPPYAMLSVRPDGDAPLGPAVVTVRFEVSALRNGTWVAAGSEEFPVTMQVIQGEVLPTPAATGINWLAQAPVLAATAGGLGYLIARHRRPRIEPRSQAMRAEVARKAKAPEEARAEREQAAEQAWEQKRKILEARREDVLKRIRIAEGRKERGELTDHMLKSIRERQERELERIEKEMEELR